MMPGTADHHSVPDCGDGLDGRCDWVTVDGTYERAHARGPQYRQKCRRCGQRAMVLAAAGGRLLRVPLPLEFSAGGGRHG